MSNDQAWPQCRNNLALMLILTSIVLSIPASCFAAGMPPINRPPTTERHVGKVIWRELSTGDIDATEAFYGALFGWRFEEVSGVGTRYGVALQDGRPVAGIVAAKATVVMRQPAWLSYLSVLDVDASRKEALRHGGKVIREPKTYLPRGRQAVLTDVDGAAFGILDSHSGDPPDDLAEPGEWIWSSLLTTHVASDIAFYQDVFGFEVFDVEHSKDADHAILATEDYARASVNTQPTQGGKRHPHWLNFVRVANVAQSVAKAKTLGGRVVVEPRIDRHGSLFAVLTDPAGAPFGVMEWVVGETAGDAK